MRFVVGFFQFWYDFIVGDCWQIAAGVVVVLGCGAVLAHGQALGRSEFGPVVGLGLVLVVVASLLTTAKGKGH
jgi:hypothetical protein